MKKVIIGILAGFAIIASMCAHRERGDSYIRDRVVQIVSDAGASCSGEQIHSKAGVDYILTAGHCKELGKDGSYHVITEDGRHMERKLIAEDPSSDLLLLEGVPGMKGIEIAHHSYAQEHVRTHTHGHAYKTYKTEGVLIQDQRMEIPLFLAETAEQLQMCSSMPKYEVVPIQTMFGPLPVCVLTVQETVMTAFISPGSSGGPVLDDDGALVGVVSASGEGYGFMVPTTALHAFLDNY